MSEQKLVVAVPPRDPHSGLPLKRRKGRPRKKCDLIPSEDNIAALPPKPDGRMRKPKRKFSDVVLQAVDSTFVGKQVRGVLDGSFDAGYLLTVRIANTEIVLRGAVFEPSLSVPVCQSNDIAPNVKFIGRCEQGAPTQFLSENANKDLPAPTIVPCADSGSMATGQTPTQGGAKPPANFQDAPAEVGQIQAGVGAHAALSSGNTPVGAISAEDAVANCFVLAEAPNRSAPLPAAATDNPKRLATS